MTFTDRRTTSALNGGLIVSVQAHSNSPLGTTMIIRAMAEAVLPAQPVAFRLNSPEHVSAVRDVADIPIIGLHKVHNGQRNIITPSLRLAEGLATAGADIIAIDCTDEVRHGDLRIVRDVTSHIGLPVMADVSTRSEGLRAWQAGATIVGTTLSGYTPESGYTQGAPDFELVSALAGQGVRVIAEGRYRTTADIAEAFERGAFAVVVGSAITDPGSIAASLAAATPRARTRAATP